MSDERSLTAEVGGTPRAANGAAALAANAHCVGALPSWATGMVLAAEENTIGALMKGADYAEVARFLYAEDFTPGHGLIISAIATVAGNRQPCNPVTVGEQLEDCGHLDAAGGIAYLVRLAQNTLGTDAITYARAVRKRALMRRLPDGFHDDRSILALKRDLAELDALQASAQSPQDPLVLQDLETFAQCPSVRWLVKGILTPETITVVFGPPKGGKTFSVVDLMMHAAHGIDWHGHKVSRPLRVVFLAGEGRKGLKVRLHAWLRHHDVALLRDGGDFRVMPQAFSLPERADELISALRDLKPDVVVTDTLNAYFGSGDENSTQDMTAYVAASRRIRDALSCSVVVLHHTPQADATRGRGSGVLCAAADVLVQVDRDQAGTDGIGFRVVGARDFEAMQSPVALRLQSVETDWQDEDGEPMVSCVVIAAAEPVTLPGKRERALGPKQGKVLACAHKLARERYPNASCGTRVALGKREISAAAQKLGVSPQNVSNAWKSLDAHRVLRVTGPGTVEVTL
jgi:hypothetical protein